MVSGRRLVLAAAVLVLAACSSDGGGPDARARPEPPAEAAPPAPATTSTLATATTPSCPRIPTRAEPDPARPRYVLRVDVQPAEGVVDGELRVRFTPDLDTDRLVFRLWPNGPRAAVGGTRLTTGAVTVEGREAPTDSPDVTTLVV